MKNTSEEVNEKTTILETEISRRIRERIFF